MRKFLHKSKDQKGFTLMEMLIVVAIIIILIAVSIPIFTAQLEKARESTDQANERAAKAAAIAHYLSMDTPAGFTMNYDAVNGKLVETTTTPTGYGKGTATAGYDTSVYPDAGENHAGGYIQVTVGADGVIPADGISWVVS